jgi:Protein of unknown function (DUF3014)
MRAEPDEYSEHVTPRSRFPFVELLLALVLAAGLAAFWFWSQREAPPATTVVTVPAIPAATPEVAPELPATPDIPPRAEAVAAAAPESTVTMAEGDAVAPAAPEVVAPLTPEQADALLRQKLSEAGARPVLKKLLVDYQPLEVSAALIDGLGRGVILRKFLPAVSHSEKFSVVTQDDGYYMNPIGFMRYDAYADAIAALDVGVLVNAFDVLRPAYEQAYGYLGLDPGDFDNAVIRILDLVLATPEIGEPIPLVPKAVVYLYADPGLESLPAVQKQLLRMGPDNIRRIKQQAQALRDGLLAQ